MMFIAHDDFLKNAFMKPQASFGYQMSKKNEHEIKLFLKTIVLFTN